MRAQIVGIKNRKYSVQRSPTLNTVLMVEDVLKNAEGVMSVAELRRKLPKQVMHQTLIAVLDYLDYSGKIAFRDSKVLWVFKEKSRLREKEGLKVR